MLLLLGIFSLISLAHSYKEFKEEDGILVLNEGNFDQALKQFPYLMVNFYAPWCVHCQKFAPDYVSAAANLKQEHIVLAKIDASDSKNLTTRFMLRGYPTLKFFRGGRPKNYEGRRSAFDLVEWLKENAVPLVTVIENMVELELFKQQQKYVLMYFSSKKEKENDQTPFNQMSDQLDGVFFGLAQSPEMRQYLGLKVDEKIVLYTPHSPTPFKLQGEITMESIWYFVHNNSYPEIMNYTPRQKLFIEEMEHPAIYLFLDGVEENIPQEVAFKEVASKLKNEIYFVRISKAEKEGREAYISGKFIDKFGIKEFPSVYIQDTRGIRPFKKYKLKGEINHSTLEKFIIDFKQDALTPYYKSQKIPIQKGPVKEVVGKSFQWEVIDTDKEVFLMFYAPWDQNSRQLMMIYESIAQKLQVNPNIVLAKLDATENEIPNYQIDSYPSFKLFQEGENDTVAVVDFSGERSADGIIQFLQKNTKFPWVDIEAVTEEELLKRKKLEDSKQKQKEKAKKHTDL